MSLKRRLVSAAVMAALVAPVIAVPASAQEHRREERREHERADHWRDRDIHRFRDHDFDRWRGGRWIHGRHAGRDGWWWVVSGLWYFYPRPVYPYPDPYAPPVVSAPGPGTYYYYCRRPAGYYPYVSTCRVPWQAVQAAPPAANLPPPGAAVPPPGTLPPR